MSEWICIQKDLKHMAREKTKARELKNSQWWKNKIAQGICYYCQEKFLPEDLTMDHKIPLARGGRSTKGNVVPCCKACNNKKSFLTPVDIILNQRETKDLEDS